MPLLTALHRHDRMAVVAIVAAVVLACWAYLLLGVDMPMQDMPGMDMPMAEPVWTAGYAGLMLLMWMAMMAAMMLPSALPMLLFYDSIAKKRSGASSAVGPTSLFGLGYLVVWAGFSLAAVLLQYCFDRAALLSPMMQTTSAALAGLILVGAGLYQWTPLKQACLRRCRSPLDFIMTGWRSGKSGAFVMGLRHGVYCLGCCWLLMLLLFVGGAMNIAWIAGIALFVLVEKLSPAGHWIGKAAGVALIVWGGAMLAGVVSTS